MKGIAVRLLLAALFTTLFLPVAFGGSDPAKPALLGVWTGSVGKFPITACFNDGWGNYYYHGHLIPISLNPKDDGSNKTATVWNEANGTWQIHSVASNRLSGTWTNPDRSRKLPISLTQVKLSAEDSSENITPCGSDAYNQSLDASITTYPGSIQSIGNVQYRIVTFAFPMGKGKNSSDAQLYIETLELIGNSPSLKSINTSLDALIGNSKDDISLCRRNAMNHSYSEGVRSQDVHASVVGHLIIVGTNNSSGCGDRISMWENTYIWSLVTGKRENLFSWFKADKSAADDEERRQSEDRLPVALDLLISTHFGKGDPSTHLSVKELEECYGEYSPGAYDYQLKLTDNGIDFAIPFTSNGSCGESFKLTFQELKPYLSTKGIQAIAAIQGAKKNAKQ